MNETYKFRTKFKSLQKEYQNSYGKINDDSRKTEVEKADAYSVYVDRKNRLNLELKGLDSNKRSFSAADLSVTLRRNEVHEFISNLHSYASKLDDTSRAVLELKIDEMEVYYWNLRQCHSNKIEILKQFPKSSPKLKEDFKIKQVCIKNTVLNDTYNKIKGDDNL